MRSPSYEPAHCIVCGHAESEVVAELDAIRRQVEALWAFHEKRLKLGTPINRLRDRVTFSEHPPFRLVACTECGLVYRNPTERAFEIESTYARDCPPRETLQTLHDVQRDAYRPQARRVSGLLHRGATVLEVGSYVGAFLSSARDSGLNAIGVDINPAVNTFARSLGFDVHDGQIGDVPVRPFDGIAIWNTFDQLEDPRAVVVAARARLKSGGLLAIRVPNGAFYKRWSRRLRGRGNVVARSLLAHNTLLTFPYRWGFTRQSLSALLRQSGLETVDVVGDVLVPTADSWTRRWARAEERMVKRILKTVSHSNGDAAPWFEVYATSTQPGA